MSCVIWTNHAKGKMRFYKLSEQRILRILNFPQRVEEGVAPNTIALMQQAGNKKRPYEIWTMIQKRGTTRKNTRNRAENININQHWHKLASLKIISAWKYPGITKPRDEILLSFFQREYNTYRQAG